MAAAPCLVADESWVVVKLRVDYPSGQGATIIGDWLGPLWVEGELVLHIEPAFDVRIGSAVVSKGSALLVDPRAVVRDGDEILYSPRLQDRVPIWVSSWLEAHPEWPQVLEL